MEVTVILGGDLRNEAIQGAQQRAVTLEGPATVGDLVRLLGLPTPRIGMILHNGHAAGLEAALKEGDRVGLFPPELRYNTFVSLYFRTGSNVDSGSGDKT